MESQNYGQANLQARTPIVNETDQCDRPMAREGIVMPPTNVARPIVIEPVNHGFLVTVNCQRFAIESKEALLHRLGAYLNDPGKVESDWMTGKLKW